MSKWDYLGGGNEHDVYYDLKSRRVVKMTKNGSSFGARGNALEYLQNLEFQACLFADTIKFEGLLETDKGWIIVTSQDFVTGRMATDDEIPEFFRRFGYVSIGDFSFRRISGALDIRVRDARPANLLVQQDLVVPIDIQIFVTPIPEESP